MKSELARCAAEIRGILKAKNIKASVRGERFSRHNSIKIETKEVIGQERLNLLQQELMKCSQAYSSSKYVAIGLFTSNYFRILALAEPTV